MKLDKQPDNQSSWHWKLAVFFVIAYIGHGISAQFGLIAQPLNYYLMRGLGMSAAQVSAALAVMMVPWMLKPVYGLVCDLVPLFGYRRKSYLVAVNLLCAGAFATMLWAEALTAIVGCLLVTASCVAASTALTVGLAVEQGKQTGQARRYFSAQTFWYYTALIVSSLAGGFLCQHLQPAQALRLAAGIAIAPSLVVSLCALVLVHEARASPQQNELSAGLAALREALRSRRLWLVALFIWCWDFSPAFGVPLYFWQTNTLGFSQAFIGQLAAWNALGMVAGSLVYRYGLTRLGLKQQLFVAVATGTASTVAYLWLGSPLSAVLLELGRGTTTMLSILCMYGLAADVCPSRTEVSVMAALIAVRNLAIEASTVCGGLLFTHVFGSEFAPLVVIAAAVTVLCALIVPYLPTGTSTEQ